jgi:hypothetical protein
LNRPPVAVWYKRADAAPAGGCRRLLLAGLVSLGFAALSAADSSSEGPTPGAALASEDLFAADELLDLQLQGSLEVLLSDASKQQVAFQLTVAGAQRPVMVTSGGKSRRKVCHYVPLRLDFAGPAGGDGPAVDQFTAGHDFLYLTTQCRDGDRSRGDLVEEYLAYRILNLLTDASYRARLLRVRYVDSGRPATQMTRHAFAVESEYALARRMGGQVLAIDGVPKRRLNEDHAAIIYIFQYLIGNTDWSLVSGVGDDVCCHNGQLVAVAAEIFYVPFDFDLAGLVNARYARPDGTLPIRRVTRRLYRGYCGPEDSLRRALDHVLSRQEAILALYRNAPLLTKRERVRGIRFISWFFDQAQEPERLLALFQRSCLS